METLRGKGMGLRSLGKQHSGKGKGVRSLEKERNVKGERSSGNYANKPDACWLYIWVRLANSDIQAHKIYAADCAYIDFLGMFKKCYSPLLDHIQLSEMLVKRCDGTVIEPFESWAYLADDNSYENPLLVELKHYLIIPTAPVNLGVVATTLDTCRLYVWVKVANSKTQAHKIDITDCTDMTDFKGALKKFYTPDLNDISIPKILVKSHDGTVIKSFEALVSLFYGNSPENPFFIELKQYDLIPIATDYFGKVAKKPDKCRLYIWVKLANSNTQAQQADVTNCYDMDDFKHVLKKLYDLDYISIPQMLVKRHNGTLVKSYELLPSLMDNNSYENPLSVELKQFEYIAIEQEWMRPGYYSAQRIEPDRISRHILMPSPEIQEVEQQQETQPKVDDVPVTQEIPASIVQEHVVEGHVRVI